MMGLAGHIMGYDYPEEYNNWHAVDPEVPLYLHAFTILAGIAVTHSLPTTDIPICPIYLLKEADVSFL